MKLAIADPAARIDDGVLVRELTHRISNEFTCIANMLSLAAARSTSHDAKAALDVAAEQLGDYVRVYRALQMPERHARHDAAAYLRNLCRSISRSRLERKNIELCFVETPVSLTGRQCWVLGMAVYELINNAARHAFGKSGGEIRIELADRGDMVYCRVSDNGTAVFSPRRGHGLTIIDDLVAGLGGDFRHELSDGGCVSIVAIPRSI
jgi:two-component sensor histidine kinase